MNRKHGLILVLVLCATAYAARRGPDLLKGYAEGWGRERMCSEVNSIVLNAKFDERSTSKLPLEVAFAKKYCWKGKT